MDDFSIEFRDGKRQVAPHVYEMLRNVETFRMTYEEALNYANGQILRSHVNLKADQFVARHFKENT